MLGIAQHCNKISLYQQRRDEQHVLSYFSLKTDKWITLNDGNANGKEFYISKSLKKTFDGAVEFCNYKGGILYEPRNTNISEILYKQMETEGIVDFWIGVNDKANEGNFVYASDNSSIAWSDWADDQPNSYGGDQDCVAVINERMGWDDRQCNGADVFHFACVRGGKC